MPVYEYRCRHCGHRLSIWWRSMAQLERSHPSCSKCGSVELERAVSRVAVIRGGDALDRLADDAGGVDEDDPRAMGRLMRELGAETGEDLGAEFHEIVDRLEAGEGPGAIESDLGGGEALSGDSFDPGA